MPRKKKSDDTEQDATGVSTISKLKTKVPQLMEEVDISDEDESEGEEDSPEFLRVLSTVVDEINNLKTKDKERESKKQQKEAEKAEKLKQKEARLAEIRRKKEEKESILAALKSDYEARQQKKATLVHGWNLNYNTKKTDLQRSVCNW